MSMFGFCLGYVMRCLRVLGYSVQPKLAGDSLEVERPQSFQPRPNKVIANKPNKRITTGKKYKK